MASEPQHTSKKNSKNTKHTHPAHHSPPIPMAPHDPMPSPFGGRPRSSWATLHYPSSTLPLKRPARYSLFLMNMRAVLHHSRYFAVPINALSFNPFGRRDDHESGAGRFAGCAHLSSLFLTRKKIKTLLHLSRWRNDQRIHTTPNTHASINCNWLIILSVELSPAITSCSLNYTILLTSCRCFQILPHLFAQRKASSMDFWKLESSTIIISTLFLTRSCQPVANLTVKMSMMALLSHLSTS